MKQKGLTETFMMIIAKTRWSPWVNKNISVLKGLMKVGYIAEDIIFIKNTTHWN